MQQIDGLYILETGARGRGVFTAVDVAQDSLIEVCQLIIIPVAELPLIHKTVLHDYYFLWGEDMQQAAIALGNGSLYNHALHPNANFILDIDRKTIDIVAIQDISAGSEITLNYHGEPGCDDALWF